MLTNQSPTGSTVLEEQPNVQNQTEVSPPSKPAAQKPSRQQTTLAHPPASILRGYIEQVIPPSGPSFGAVYTECLCKIPKEKPLAEEDETQPFDYIWIHIRANAPVPTTINKDERGTIVYDPGDVHAEHPVYRLKY